jgi:hypothetical protein
MAQAQPPAEPETDLHPREFAVALLMAACWYFAGPWGIIPTLAFLYLILKEKPRWLGAGARLLPVRTRRALAAQAGAVRREWQELTAPWRETPPAQPHTPAALPAVQAAWGDADPLAESLPEEHSALPLPLLSLAELAARQNILIVGSPGSGKSTLLNALVAARRWRCYVLDPHNHPGKWAASATVIGGGRGFQAIYAALQRAEAELDVRAKRLNVDASARFAPFSLAGDEWGSVCSEISVPKEADPPGRLLTRLLKEGRKFGISFLGAAHGDTAASLGSSGDTAAFRYSFDAIVYMGGFTTQQLKDTPEAVGRLPMGRTPEGKAFPLMVIVSSPITGERALLDLRNLPPPTSTTPPASPMPPVLAASPSLPTPDLMLHVAEHPIAPGTNARTAELAAEPLIATPPVSAPARASERTEPTTLRGREDLVRLLVAAGWGVTQIRDAIKGTSAEIGALVRQIEDEQLRAQAGSGRNVPPEEE